MITKLEIQMLVKQLGSLNMIKLDRVKQNYTENNNVQTSFDQIGRN